MAEQRSGPSSRSNVEFDREPGPGSGRNTQPAVVDFQLIVSARAGSASAFGVLVDRYYAEVATYLHRLVGDRELADDLTQETFLTVYAELHQIPDRGSFASWLYTVAHHRAMTVLRRRKLLRFVSLDQVTDVVGNLFGRGPSEHPDDISEREVVQQALDRLSDEQRVAVLLHSFAGFKTEEIAAIIGEKSGTAGKRISRGRERFRELYEQLNDSSSSSDSDSDEGAMYDRW